MARIDGIQKALATRFQPGLLNLETKLRNYLEGVLKEEEILWYQKSREKWILFGDKNTRYFHTTTLIQWQRNKIKGLTTNVGEWIWDQSVMERMAIEYFSNLFSIVDHQLIGGYIPCSFPRWSPKEIRMLARRFSVFKVRNAVFGMGPYKAPGPDGFQPAFYQKL